MGDAEEEEIEWWLRQVEAMWGIEFEPGRQGCAWAAASYVNKFRSPHFSAAAA